MDFNFIFFLNSILFGVGLAMDAFSVSLANGLNEPCMSKRRMIFVAGGFAVFQALMPMLGWACLHALVSFFSELHKYIPWIAFILLIYIGGNMLYDGISHPKREEKCTAVTVGALVLQWIATSIDALSVGFTISEYTFPAALLFSSIIAAVTFCICFAGIAIGKHIGTRLSNKASIFGGMILVFIGIEILLTGIF